MNTSLQNWLIKIVPRSLVIVFDMPCSLYTLSRKNWTTCTIVNEHCRAMKWAYLVNQSMTIKTHDFPRDFGKRSMKSMVISVKTPDGTSKGCSNLGLIMFSLLNLWQIEQVLMKFLTSFQRPPQYTINVSYLAITLSLEWPLRAEQWNKAIRSFRKFMFLPTINAFSP